ncbi:hypothetical protein [Jiella mangrovi]|uniref:DUF680 domain-containing protein n=1 Tax=Jiella mangrovi TaxID=2821407 RepID=A0ABS4BID4_9HYPH|nr:hypothetical protein [Jiella mangrovi]MBP0616515.1 hypothetical protein [Jiella mangrovi]
MKNSLAVAAMAGGLLFAPAASFAGGLVPGSGADFTPAPKVEKTTTYRDDDKISTGSTKSYGSQASSSSRRTLTQQQSRAENDSGFVQRRAILVPGSGADFTK